MFSPRLRIGLIAVSCALALAHVLVRRDWTSAAVPIAATLLLVHGHSRYGTVWLAFRTLRSGTEVSEAERLLRGIKRPEWLTSSQRGYYELMMGYFVLEAGRASDALVHLDRTREFPLRSARDRALADFLVASALDLTGGDSASIDDACEGASACDPPKDVLMSIAWIRLKTTSRLIASLGDIHAFALVSSSGHLWRFGARATDLPERLAALRPDSGWPGDAGERLYDGETISWIGPTNEVFTLRAFAARRGFYLAVADNAVHLETRAPYDLATLESNIVDAESLGNETVPLSAAEIGDLLGS